MKSFVKPEFFNGAELVTELKAANIAINGYPEIDQNNVLWLDVDDSAKTQKVLEKHNGTIIPPDLSAKRQAVLDKLGLTADEVAALLG
jgi:hypothetical protein